jgi:hypothetical protein
LRFGQCHLFAGQVLWGALELAPDGAFVELGTAARGEPEGKNRNVNNLT